MPLDIWLTIAIWTSAILSLVLAICQPHRVVALYALALFSVVAWIVLLHLC